MNQPDPQILWKFVLVTEVESVNYLARAAVEKIISNPSGITSVADPMFACLSLAIEKVLKLTIGLDGIAATGQWPAPKVMSDPKKGWKHRIADMDVEVLKLIVAGTSTATNPGFVEAALKARQNHPHVPTVVKAMDDYAQRGRFHGLDYLAAKPNLDPYSPRQLWQEIEQTVAQTQTGGDHDRFRADVVKQTVTAVAVWFDLVRMAWVQQVFGALGRQLSVGLPTFG